MAHNQSEDDRPLGELKGELQANFGSKSENDTHSRQSSKGHLVDKVTNSWREKSTDADSAAVDDGDFGLCDLEDDRSIPNTTMRLYRSRQFRKMLLITLLVGFLLYQAYKRLLRPTLERDWTYSNSYVPERVNGTYGIAKGGHFTGTWTKELDPKLLPGGQADPHGKRRLVFVGDIHGCRSELDHLLKKIRFDPDQDHLVATGDVISKGPDNVGVLDELIRLGADSPRGNHEDRLLGVAKSMDMENVVPPDFTTTGRKKDRALLKELHHKHFKYLRDMPLILRIPALPLAKPAPWGSKTHLAEEILVVHAGLVPHISLEKQDPYFVMNMRSIDHRTHVPSDVHGEKAGRVRPWFDIWNWYNDRVARGRSTKDFFSLELDETKKKPTPQVVMYGHDSKLGLQLNRWSKGLDTRCVKGGELTALVLEASGKFQIVSVGCRNYHP